MRSIARRTALLTILLGLGSPVLAQLRPHIVASGFDRPVVFAQDPTDPAVQLVAELSGHIRVLVNYAIEPVDYLDLSGLVHAGDMSLLGFAIAPDYATSGRVFVNYINKSGYTVIARYTRSQNSPRQADPASRFPLVWPTGLDYFGQPILSHKAGNLMFGPDGYLYVGTGDGTPLSDPYHNAQNPLSLLGKMLRLNVSVGPDDPQGYDVPSDNPFVGRPDVYGEIWSFGLRNPWRWSFDDVAHGGTGALIIGDVGQDDFEEIDYAPAGVGGRNYGWRNREGAHPHVEDVPPYSEPLTDPIFEYEHGDGAACVTGGYVYRGQALGPAMAGRYVFGDCGSGRIWSLHLDVDPDTHETTASDLQDHTDAFGGPSMWVSFGTDWAGELYALSYDGNIWKFDATPGPATSAVVLWTTNNAAHTWFLNGDSFLGMVGFSGPALGWTAHGYSRNADQSYELLWTEDNMARLWFFNANNTWVGGLTFAGPGAGWKATGYFRNPDGSYGLLWTGGGDAQVWTLNANNTWGSGFGLGGPGADWTATSYFRAPDGSHRVLWTRDHEAQLWTITSTLDWGGMVGLGGPAEGWTATGYNLKGDGSWNVVWTAANLAQVWTITAAGDFNSMIGMTGPGAAWTVQNYVK